MFGALRVQDVHPYRFTIQYMFLNFHGEDWVSPAYLDCKYVQICCCSGVTNKINYNVIHHIIYYICTRIARDLQAITQRWISNNPIGVFFEKKNTTQGDVLKAR